MISPTPPVYLVDTSGFEWQLFCGNGGAPIQTVPVTGQTAFASILINDIGMAQTGGLTIVPNPSPYMGVSPGDIHIDPVTYSPGTPLQIAVNSPDGTLWWIQVDGGLLATNLGTAVCTPPLGTLYIANYNGIAWSQPGGPGTIVYPQQNTGSFGYPGDQLLMQEKGQGLWVSGCQHWLDTWQIWKDINVCTNQNVAILTCPICSFIQQIITPYEAAFNVIEYPILVG